MKRFATKKEIEKLKKQGLTDEQINIQIELFNEEQLDREIYERVI